MPDLPIRSSRMAVTPLTGPSPYPSTPPIDGFFRVCWGLEREPDRKSCETPGSHQCTELKLRAERKAGKLLGDIGWGSKLRRAA